MTEQLTAGEAVERAREVANRRRRAGSFAGAMAELGFRWVGGESGQTRDPANWERVPDPPSPRVTDEKRKREARAMASGLLAAIDRADTQDDWAEISRRAGAIQRRARLLGGLGRGG